MKKEKVAIFRHQLFKVSEPFITNQAERLDKFQAIYIGRERFGESPQNAQSFALQDLPLWNGFPLKHYQVISRTGKPYIGFLKKNEVKLIHAHFGVEGLYACSIKERLNIPLITTFHGFDATLSVKSLLMSGSPAWINYATFRKRLSQEGDAFLCVSDYIKQRAILLGFPEEKVCTHYIGIETESVEERVLPDSDPILLHVGRLVEKKGTEYLIDAFAILAKEDSYIKLNIIGDGPLRDKLEAKVALYGLQKRISFLGSLPNKVVHEYMRKSIALIVPSITATSGDTEGLPIVILEAAAMGVPVIGTLHSGIPEAVINEKTGFLVPERDAQTLAERIIFLVKNKSFAEKLGKRSRQMVEEKFNIRKQTEKLESIYKEML